MNKKTQMLRDDPEAFFVTEVEKVWAEGRRWQKMQKYLWFLPLRWRNRFSPNYYVDPFVLLDLGKKPSAVGAPKDIPPGRSIYDGGEKT